MLLFRRILLGSGAVAMLLAIAYAQSRADALRPRAEPASGENSLRLVRAFDLGLHSALASVLWLDTRTELPFLQNGYPEYRDGLALVNALDPKWNTPYAYTVLNLPYAADFPGRDRAAVRAGEEGLRSADPDWRIPFYLGALYELNLKDPVRAARYFDLTARTPGVPDPIRRFVLNYGLFPTLRDKVRAIWAAMYEEAPDQAARDRAQAYVLRLDVVKYLQAAADRYKAAYGAYPQDLSELVRRGFIPRIPPDPFDFEFAIEDGAISIRPPQ